MTTRLTDYEAKLAAALLDIAREKYSRGCNDISLGKHAPEMTDEQKVALHLAYHQWNGDPKNFSRDGDHDRIAEWKLQAYMASRLRGVIPSPEPDECPPGEPIRAEDVFGRPGFDVVERGGVRIPVVSAGQAAVYCGSDDDDGEQVPR